MKKNNKNNDYYYSLSIIKLLLFENDTLRKKLNNEELRSKEEIFLNYIISPSFIVKNLIERTEKNEVRNQRKNKQK